MGLYPECLTPTFLNRTGTIYKLISLPLGKIYHDYVENCICIVVPGIMLILFSIGVKFFLVIFLVFV